MVGRSRAIAPYSQLSDDILIRDANRELGPPSGAKKIQLKPSWACDTEDSVVSTDGLGGHALNSLPGNVKQRFEAHPLNLAGELPSAVAAPNSIAA